MAKAKPNSKANADNHYEPDTDPVARAYEHFVSQGDMGPALAAAREVVRGMGVSDEVASLTMEALWQELSNGKQIRNARAFVRCTARNKAKDIARSEGARRRRERVFGESHASAPPSETVEPARSPKRPKRAAGTLTTLQEAVRDFIRDRGGEVGFDIYVYAKGDQNPERLASWFRSPLVGEGGLFYRWKAAGGGRLQVPDDFADQLWKVALKYGHTGDGAWIEAKDAEPVARPGQRSHRHDAAADAGKGRAAWGWQIEREDFGDFLAATALKLCLPTADRSPPSRLLSKMREADRQRESRQRDKMRKIFRGIGLAALAADDEREHVDVDSVAPTERRCSECGELLRPLVTDSRGVVLENLLEDGRPHTCPTFTTAVLSD